MKPRLTQGWTSVWLGTWIDLHGWYCSGDGRSKWGATPEGAYREWAKPSWPPGAVIEQHLCPPKPTLWQKFRRFAKRMDDLWPCDIFTIVVVK